VLMVNCMSSAQSLSCSKRLGAMGVLTVCTVVLILHEFFFGCLFWLMKQTLNLVLLGMSVFMLSINLLVTCQIRSGILELKS
jgi:hypothetical protein